VRGPLHALDREVGERRGPDQLAHLVVQHQQLGDRPAPAVAGAAALAAALVETLPVRLDDNISVPFTAGAVLWLASLMSADAMQTSSGSMFAALPWAIGVLAATAWFTVLQRILHVRRELRLRAG